MQCLSVDMKVYRYEEAMCLWRMKKVDFSTTIMREMDNHQFKKFFFQFSQFTCIFWRSWGYELNYYSRAYSMFGKYSVLSKDFLMHFAIL